MNLNPATVLNAAFSDESIAGFGDARLVRKLNGDYQLFGGTDADRTAAKQWISLFMHEAAVSFWPRLGSEHTIQDEPPKRAASARVSRAGANDTFCE